MEFIKVADAASVTADKVISLPISQALTPSFDLHRTYNTYFHRFDPKVTRHLLRRRVRVHDVDLRQGFDIRVKVKCRGKLLNASGPQLSNGAPI